MTLYETILHRMADGKDAILADAIGCDRTKIVRIRSLEHGVKLDELEPFLRALGLKVVDEDGHVVSEERLRSLLAFARDGIDMMINGVGK